MYSLFLFSAFAASPVVTIATDIVAGAPIHKGVAENGWVPVLADCLEEGRLKRVSVVDRSRGGLTSASLKDDVQALRDLKPMAIVIEVGAHEAPDGDVGAFHDQIEAVVQLLRADGGPQVYLVGLVAPTVVQIENTVKSQELADEGVVVWNSALEKIASADDGVWQVNLLAGWPREPSERAQMTRGGYALTDAAHARVGAVICEQILANLRNRRK